MVLLQEAAFDRKSIILKVCVSIGIVRFSTLVHKFSREKNIKYCKKEFFPIKSSRTFPSQGDHTMTFENKNAERNKNLFE